MKKQINIIVFGGTSQGEEVLNLLNSMQVDFFYSTKSFITINNLDKKKYFYGDMNQYKMEKCFVKNKIDLIINASHPFASELHNNIYTVSNYLKIPVIRFERETHELIVHSCVHYFSNFKDITNKLIQLDPKKALALSGVNSIEKLKRIWKEKNNIIFRIMNHEDSLKKIEKLKFNKKNLIIQNPKEYTNDIEELISKIKPDVLILKESGNASFFKEKIQAAIKNNIKTLVLKRKNSLDFNHIVYTLDDLKTTISHYLEQPIVLKSGFTTGTCVLACVKASLLSLLNNKIYNKIEVELPSGIFAEFNLYHNKLENKSCSYTVIKRSGDDPDITNSEDIGCEISFNTTNTHTFTQGVGVGQVTLKGLELNLGEPAINPSPRKMILNEIQKIVKKYNCKHHFTIKPFIPNGENLAKKTFNPKIGIKGGLSIIGTSGIIKPFSNEAFIASIKKYVNVAAENGATQLVINSGAKSESYLKERFKEKKEIAYVSYGNFIGETLKIINSTSIKKVYMGIMIGKAIKLAEGKMDTHSKNSVFSNQFMVELAKETNYPISIQKAIQDLKLSRGITDIIPFNHKELYYKELILRCTKNCSKLLLNANLQVLLLDIKGNILTL